MLATPPIVLPDAAESISIPSVMLPLATGVIGADEIAKHQIAGGNCPIELDGRSGLPRYVRAPEIVPPSVLPGAEISTPSLPWPSSSENVPGIDADVVAFDQVPGRRAVDANIGQSLAGDHVLALRSRAAHGVARGRVIDLHAVVTEVQGCRVEEGHRAGHVRADKVTPMRFPVAPLPEISTPT